MFSYGDIVRLIAPTGEADHNGTLRVWSCKTVFRVLHPTHGGEVVVVDDSRGLRVTFQSERLCMVTRAEHTSGRAG